MLVRGRPSERAAIEAWLGAPPSAGERVAAAQAVPMALGKMKMEAPILAAAGDSLGGRPTRAPGPFQAPDDLELTILGARLIGGLQLHPNTQTIIAAERPFEALVAEAERGAALLALEQALVVALEQDTAKNTLELAPRVHAELARRARAGEALELAAVDVWLYARLFETPASDPWLGLVDPSVYTGLVEGGIAKP